MAIGLFRKKSSDGGLIEFTIDSDAGSVRFSRRFLSRIEAAKECHVVVFGLRPEDEIGPFLVNVDDVGELCGGLRIDAVGDRYNSVFRKRFRSIAIPEFQRLHFPEIG